MAEAVAENQEAQESQEKVAAKRSRVMTVAPFSKDAGIEAGHMLHFDASENELAKNVGRALLIKGEGDAAEKVFGRYFLNTSQPGEGEDKTAKTYINVQFDEKSSLKSVALFKTTGEDGHNYFSGTLEDAEGKKSRITANLVSTKGDEVKAWLGDYTFKKDLAPAEAAADEDDEDDSHGPR